MCAGNRREYYIETPLDMASLASPWADREGSERHLSTEPALNTDEAKLQFWLPEAVALNRMIHCTHLAEGSICDNIPRHDFGCIIIPAQSRFQLRIVHLLYISFN